MSDISQLNKIFNDQIEKLPKKVGLCLSGGIDSVALLSLLLENKKKVSIYSFTLEDHESFDFITARELAERFKCEFNPVYLPTDMDILKKDILRLHKKYNCCKKTEYECVWPFLYIYPAVKEKVIVTGLGAEGHFGTTKRGAIHYHDKLDEFRDTFFGNKNVSQSSQHKKLYEENNKVPYFPFLTKEIRDYFRGKTWEEVNKPKLKQPILDLIHFDITVKSSNLQLGSGVADHFDKLLKTDWNTNNYKSVVGILNAVNRGELSNAKRKLI